MDWVDAFRRTRKDAARKLYSFFHARNMPVILHSCGDVREV